MFTKKLVFHIFSVLIVLISILGFESGPSVSAKDYAQKPSRCLGEGAEIAYHARTGKIRFLGTKPGKPIPQPIEGLRNGAPEDAARGYLAKCGSLFGLSDQASELILKRERKTEDRRSIIHFQQMYLGLPIFGGELVIQLSSANDVILVNGDMLPDIKLDTQPSSDAAAAETKALQIVAAKHNINAENLRVSEAQLWIYGPAILSQSGQTSLVWRVEVTPVELAPIRELVLIDAHSGDLILNFNQVDSAKDRLTYTANNTTTRPGTLVCNEPNPTCSGGDTDAVNAHIYSGDTYDFYFNYHGRDSIDNAGMSLISTVHYDVGYCNAFWDGSQMTYGDGCFIVADDVVAHEMTHGVTQNESNLIYSYQSGAINESFSDIWGEFVDLTNGKGTDTSAMRWLMGEDTSIGAIRNMKDPTLLGQPDRMDSPYYYYGIDDSGGVHTNSGVGNKAAYLITDGATFNGYTVTGIGINKAAKVYYEAQTNILTSTSNYYSLYNALFQACNNLIGTSGITAANCTEVREATLATEMDHYPPPPPSPNDDWDTPEVISSLPYSNTQSTTGATTAPDDPVLTCLSGQGFNSVWYRYTPASSQTVTFDTFGSDYDTVLAVWTGSRGSPVSEACNDDTSGLQSQVTVALTAGVSYSIEVTSYGIGGGNLTLHATGSGPVPIFADDFETGDFSKWPASSCVTDGGDLSVSMAAKFMGNYGMQALLDDNIAIYCTSDHPNAEPRYLTSFHFDPNSIAMVSGDTHVIFGGYAGASTLVLRLQFRKSSGAYQVQASLLNDASTWKTSSWFTISDAYHQINLDWRAASAAGANNGGMTLWIDGVQKADLTAVDNDTRRIDRARLGAVAGIDVGTRGTYFFDDFVSSRGDTGPEPVIANFIGDPTSGLAPLTVSFTNTSQPAADITSYYWEFGDGGTSTETHPVYTYTSPGEYTVTLTAYAESQQDTEVKINYIQVLSSDTTPPNLSWIAPVGDGQVYDVGNESIQLEVSASDNIGISHVVFSRWDYVNGRSIEIGRVYSPPYRINFDTIPYTVTNCAF